MVWFDTLTQLEPLYGTLPEKAAAKTAVWRAERKCFLGEFSAGGENTLKTFAYETQVFLLYAENMGMAKAIFFCLEYCCAR